MSKRFTAAMMIEALSKLPPDAPLVVAGYEGGYCDVSGVFGPSALLLDANEDDGIFGPHSGLQDGEIFASGVQSFFLIGPDASGSGRWGWGSFSHEDEKDEVPE